MQPSIRTYADGDLEDLVAIEQASFPSAWPREALVEWIGREDTACHVLELEGEVVGFSIVSYEPDGLHLANLAVHPAYHRRGLALRVLENVDRVARERGAERVVLEVLETNLKAQLLYRKAGYRAVQIVSRYFRDQDGYRMVKRFGPTREARS